MTIQTSYLLIISMDVDPAHEDTFNEVYDTEHLPHLLSVPGIKSITRFKGLPFSFAIAGEIKQMPTASPVYTALYEIDSPDVLSSPEWAHAVEQGRWATEVRPFTTNRIHCVYEKKFAIESED